MLGLLPNLSWFEHLKLKYEPWHFKRIVLKILKMLLIT